jgi:hypothetical protein
MRSVNEIAGFEVAGRRSDSNVRVLKTLYL